MSIIDLNSDLGEGFGRWTLGDDAEMLGIVTSANIACGFHAGDPLVIRETVIGARDAGVAIGAHVGYRDLAGFGRRNMDVSSTELVADVIYQIGALQGIARAAGTTVTYVKPHGALYNTIVHDTRQAHDVVTAVREIDPSLALLGLPGSEVLRAADAAGLRCVTEAFADRAYTPGGTLVSRREPARCCTTPNRSPSGWCNWPPKAPSPPSTAAPSRSPPTRSACTVTARAPPRWPARCGWRSGPPASTSPRSRRDRARPLGEHRHAVPPGARRRRADRTRRPR